VRKIVIVEVDEQSLQQVAGWPWHRDEMAHLLDAIYAMKPKVVGFDVIFSEEDRRVPDGLREVLREKDVSVTQWETDNQLIAAFERYSDRLVMGLVAHEFAWTNVPEEPAQIPVSPYIPKFAFGMIKLEDYSLVPQTGFVLCRLI